MSVVIGWDIGGAHLKAARVRHGRVEAVVQAATPLWLGLDSLETAFDALRAELGPRRSSRDHHDRRILRRLSLAPRGRGRSGCDRGRSSRPCGPEPLRRPRGLRRAWRSRRRTPPTSPRPIGMRAPRWWRSSFGTRCSSTSARRQRTSFQSSRAEVAAVGYSDAERLASGELIYTGMTRSFVMALASQAPFRGAWTPLMNEYFASSADVHRILRRLARRRGQNGDRRRPREDRRGFAGASCADDRTRGGRRRALGMGWACGLVRGSANTPDRRRRLAASVPQRCRGRGAGGRGRRRGKPRGGSRAPSEAALYRIFFADRGPGGGLALRARGRGRMARGGTGQASGALEGEDPCA